jgi:hypothetical protein
MSRKIEDLNLYSKEVQDILGRMPSWIFRNGNVMIAILLLVLIAGSWFFRYPDIITAPVVIKYRATNVVSCIGYLQLSQNSADRVRTGQCVNLKLAAYPYLKFGVLKGVIGEISAIPFSATYEVEVLLPDSLVSTYGRRFEFRTELSGDAEIVTEDIRLLDRILRPVSGLVSKKPAN